MGEARDIAQRITVNGPLAVRATKIALNHAKQGKSKELGDHLGEALASLLASEDHKESTSAFIEKRKPKYLGR